MEAIYFSERLPLSELHNVIILKTALFIVVAMNTSSPT
jgi:hypothetical protein